MSASLVVQKALRARLVGTPAVVALVPAASILDRNSRPAPDPAIVLGEDQVIEGEDIARRNVRVVSTLHVWRKEGGLVGVKQIAAAIRASVKAVRFDPSDGHHFGDCRVVSERYLRDPDGETAHGVVTIETLVQEPVGCKSCTPSLIMAS